MTRRGSPKMQKRSSPRSGAKRKKRSPKANCSCANWNLGLERGLVEILQDHDNDFYRGQNGWSSEAWNIMVRKFHEKFRYVQHTKDQIQDKEKDLKRDFKVLKEARKQSGVHWDEKLCMIIADPPIWNNIITSNARASKFQRQSFPLYDELFKLYDGKTAEGNLAFISVEPKDDDDVRPVQPPMEKVTHDETIENLAFLSGYSDGHQHDDADDDDDVRIVHRPNQVCASTTSKRDASISSKDKGVVDPSISSRDKSAAGERRDEELATSGAKGTRIGQKRKQNGDVAEMMGRYLELKTKQTEEKVAEQERARTKAEASDFSIKNCIAMLGTMKELSGEDKADAYDVFKDVQNMEIFMTAEPSSRLLWLKKKIRLINSSS